MKNNITLCLVDVKVPYAREDILPLNLLSLASYLVEHKILKPKQIKIVNSSSRHSIERIIEYKPTIIGMSVVTPAYPYALKLAKTFKKKLHVAVIIGGHHITGIPALLGYPFDVGVMGEGEGPLADIVRIMTEGKPLTPETLRHVPNVIYIKHDGGVVQNPMRPLLNPEGIPKYNWSLQKREEIFQYKTVVEDGRARTVANVPMFSARGCPYRCVFCARQILWKTGAAFRFLPIDQVVDDIEYLYRTYHISSIEFLDDTFAVSKQRIRELLDKLKQKGLLGKVVFSQIFVRANLIDEEFALLLKELRVLAVFMGIESGSQRILKFLKNGSLQIHHVKRAMKLFAQQRIRVYGSFMLFVPGEKVADMNKTYALASWFAHQENVHGIGQNLTVPYPGTKLWDDAVTQKHTDIQSLNWKYFVTSYYQLSIGHMVFFRNGLSIKQLNAYWKRMYELVEFINQKNRSLPGWKESVKETDVKSQELAARLAMKRRIERIVRNPTHIFSYLLKAVSRITH